MSALKLARIECKIAVAKARAAADAEIRKLKVHKNEIAELSFDIDPKVMNQIVTMTGDLDSSDSDERRT